MTLIGTVIYVPPKDDEPGKFVPFAGDASSTLVTTLLDGTQGQTVRVFACDEPDQCLNPTFRDMSRSEEHTSELQSLMRISYAVFCLQHTKTEKQKSSYHS